MGAVTKILTMETMFALLMCAMAADFSRAKKSTGTPPSHATSLMLPRLQLEIKAEANKVVLHVFNSHLIQSDPNNLTKAINCHVTGGHMEMGRDNKWKQLTTVTLHSVSKPLTWRSPEILGGILQTRTDIEVTSSEEGMLSCNDTVGLNLTSNSVLLRFRNTQSAVVSLLAPHSVVVYDLVEDFRYMSSHEMVARLLRTKTLDNGVVVVARVSYYNETEVEDDQLIEMTRNLSRVVARKRKATVMYVRSTCCCSRVEDNGFHWPATSYGRTVVPLNPCVDDRGSPGPSQRCVGDFILGVQWERQYQMRRDECGNTGHRAQRLQNMSDPTHMKTTMNDLLDVVKQGGLDANEITLVSRSLMNIAQNFTSAGVVVSSPPIDVVAKVVSTVLDSGRDAINDAEKASGSSKDILDTVDELVAAAAISGHHSNVTEQHISLLAIPKAAGIKGVAALPMEGDPSRVQLVSIPCNDSLEDVLMMSPSSAALLLECPDTGTSFASTVFQDDSLFPTRDEGKRTASPVVGMTLLDGNKATLIPLETKVTLLLLFPKGNGTAGQCSFWDKEVQDWSSAGCAPTKLNVSKSEVLGDFNACVCTHLTHFAMLLSIDPSELEGLWTDQHEQVVTPNDLSKPKENKTLPSDENVYETEKSDFDQLSTFQNESVNISYIQIEKDEPAEPEEINRGVLEEVSPSQTKVEDEDSMKKRMDEDPLHKLSLIACSVSLVCLLCIFVVAAVSKNWRRGVGRKLQLHMSASLALLMAANITVQLLPGQIKEDGPSKDLCVILGILLHYALLSTFSWMLVVAVLQAIRLNPRSVLDSRSRSGNHLVLKASIFGWGFPLLPVTTILCSGSNVYAIRRGTSLCYPKGVAFYASVVAPVGLVIVVNICVFIFIFRSMFCNNRVGMRIHQGAKRRIYLRRISFGLFLFCLLGLNWAVGLLLQALTWNVTAYRIVAYIFCSTATLQGASLFIFFVACERHVSDKIVDDIAKLKRRSYDVAARFRQYRKSISSTSERIVSTPEST